MKVRSHSLSPSGARGLAAVCAAVFITSVHTAQAGTFTTFDPPGSTGTNAYAINPAGAITGYYADASHVPGGPGIHGFLRAPDGSFTTFDGPGSLLQTTPNSINPAGAITGSYLEESFVGHGFLRGPDGTFTTFDVPGARATSPTGINPVGAITGVYHDASPVGHGFVRAPDGTLTTFDAPGAATQGTFAVGINPAGAITGFSYDASNMFHGFLRAPDGTFTTFDVPGSTSTATSGINPAGAIAGYSFHATGIHGFLRAPDGTFTTFDAPGSASTSGITPYAINTANAITGVYSDASDVAHGFLWIPACVGDCGGTDTVAINDLITLVNIALGTAQPSTCPHGVPSGSEVNIALIIKAVNNALNGCGGG